MTLKEAKSLIESKIEGNKQDILNSEKHIADLNRGLIYLNGQLDLIAQMIKGEEERLVAGAKELADKLENKLSEVKEKVDQVVEGVEENI